jgi:hypothetical protein
MDKEKESIVTIFNTNLKLKQILSTAGPITAVEEMPDYFIEMY